MDIQNDGLFRAQDGSWISFSYQIADNRLAMVAFYTHEPHGRVSEPHVTWFNRETITI